MPYPETPHEDLLFSDAFGFEVIDFFYFLIFHFLGLKYSIAIIVCLLLV